MSVDRGTWEMIEWKCHGCGATLRVTDDKGGKKGKCPKCGTLIQVPMPAAPPEAPVIQAVPPTAPVLELSPPTSGNSYPDLVEECMQDAVEPGLGLVVGNIAPGKLQRAMEGFAKSLGPDEKPIALLKLGKGGRQGVLLTDRTCYYDNFETIDHFAYDQVKECSHASGWPSYELLVLLRDGSAHKVVLTNEDVRSSVMDVLVKVGAVQTGTPAEAAGGETGKPTGSTKGADWPNKVGGFFGLIGGFIVAKALGGGCFSYLIGAFAVPFISIPFILLFTAMASTGGRASRPTSEGDSLDGLQEYAGDDAVGFAAADDLDWLCVCGTRNPLEGAKGGDNCVTCHRNRDFVLANFTEKAIAARRKEKTE